MLWVFLPPHPWGEEQGRESNCRSPVTGPDALHTLLNLNMAATLSGRYDSCLWRRSEVRETKEINELESPGLSEGHFDAFP